jgi:hypothetical protein
MKERPKLGRGLEDISRYFLSGTAERNRERHEDPSPMLKVRSFGVCHPGSALIQSCFLANLALELARRRHDVVIHDFFTAEEVRVRTLMHGVLTEDGIRPDKAVVRLYGLPEILISENESEGVSSSEDAPGPGLRPFDDAKDTYHLINIPSLDFVLGNDAISEYILLTMTDESSLLRSYAFIKAMSKKSGAPGIHVAFDDTPTQEDADRILSRFLGFIKDHLGCTVSYLGRLVQDEQLHLSIKQQRPLVLFHGNSVAKDTITGIFSQLLDGALV